MANRTPITVRLDHFEGPLDLLLYLIQSHELDISKISITRITNQYLHYVHLMQELNFDIASEFLVMAATLLHWKSKALLPDEEGPEINSEADFSLSPDDLLHQLQEHQRFLTAAEELSHFPRLGEEIFTRPNLRPPIDRIWRNMNLSDLTLSYQDTLIRSRRRKQILKKETVSLNDKIIEFSQRLLPNQMIEFSKLISDPTSRPEKVVTFLATLELTRLRKMKLYQQEVYRTIYLELLESLEAFDFQMATSFHPLQTPRQELTQ
jgi:segregation and condensation protein A